MYVVQKVSLNKPENKGKESMAKFRYLGAVVTHKIIFTKSLKAL
jgi:hypothetical protein